MTTFVINNEEELDNLIEILREKINNGKSVYVSNRIASYNVGGKKSKRIQWYFTPDAIGDSVNMEKDLMLAIYIKGDD